MNWKSTPKRMWPHIGSVRSTPRPGAMGWNTSEYKSMSKYSMDIQPPIKMMHICRYTSKVVIPIFFFFCSPVPKDNVPRERLPMVDPTWFKTRTTIPRQPKALQPVPHGGLKSLYAESFQQPSDVKAKENYYCAVDTPFVLPSKFLDNYTFHVCVSGIIS